MTDGKHDDLPRQVTCQHTNDARRGSDVVKSRVSFPCTTRGSSLCPLYVFTQTSTSLQLSIFQLGLREETDAIARSQFITKYLHKLNCWTGLDLGYAQMFIKWDELFKKYNLKL